MGYSVPDFWLGQILIILFAVTLGLLPSQGIRSPRSIATGFDAFLETLPYLILPTLALSVRFIALFSRITRSAMLDVLNADFVLGARAKGLSEGRVLIMHVLRNAALPIVTVVGYNASTKYARTKKGEQMCMLNLTDADGTVDVVIWPRQFKQFYSVISTSKALRVTGTVRANFGVISLMADKIEGVEFKN